MKSPFKFLDSYTREDRGIFFGRDREISELYRRVFESKILLVYGVSGTGKSSLINCGLASGFDDSDWLPVNVRRGSNIIESLNEAFNKQALSPLKKNLSLSEKLQSIYLDHFKPVYLIFDQFEELFIFGSSEEKTGFIKLIKEVVESETQCRVIFIIREEFLAGITEFEYDLPEIFSNRFRVEKMKRVNAIRAVEGPCKVYDIETESGFSEELIDKLCPSGNEIELTFLQIYLDRIFRIAVEDKHEDDNLKFSKELLSRAGSVSDLLGQFLEEQIREFDDPDTGMAILKSFVSVQGTKRPMREQEVLNSTRAFGLVLAEDELMKYLSKLVSLRILRERDESGHFELRHDSLASKIYEKFTAIEKDIIEVRQFIENAFSVYEKRGKLLSKDDLKYIAPYEDKLFLNKPSGAFINESKNEITRTTRRRRNFAGFAGTALIIVLAGFTFWALSEKQKALNEKQKALSEKQKSDQNYLKAKANNFNYLSKETIETDPTIALRLAEYAMSIDSGNENILKNISKIYSENAFYRIVAKHERPVDGVAFSPDGKSILTGSEDKTAMLCDLHGNVLQVFRGHEDAILSVSFSPDGKRIITGSYDKTARLWNLQGNVLQVFKGHKGVISSGAFSPDGKSFLTGSWDKTARLWDLQGNVLKVLRGHKEAISSVAFSPDGKNILTGSYDKTARFWDLNGNVCKVFRGHKNGIRSVAFSPDGKNILTGSVDNTARLWDLNGNVIHVFRGHESSIMAVAFSPDGKRILTGSEDRTVTLWDLNGNVLQIFKGHEGLINSLAFSPDGISILTGSYDKTARIWELQGNVIQVFKGSEKAICSVAYSPDGKNILIGSSDNTPRLWDPHGNVLQVFRGHEDAILSVSFSPEGKSIITGSYDGTARLWDLNGNAIQVFRGHEVAITSVAFSPDGKSILTGSVDRTARLWDLHGNVLQVFRGHESYIMSVAFSPDGKNILTGSYDYTTRLWDLKGNVIRMFKGNESWVTSVAFSPDGNRILTGSNDGTARLWDLNVSVFQVFRGHVDAILSVAYSPDGKSILTGSRDRTARLWDMQANVIQIFKGHDGGVASVAFSPDGKNILTGSEDNTARLWNIKQTYKEAQSGDAYQVLSFGQKIRYGILEFNDILKLTDEKSIYETAEYYYEERNLVGKENKTEYINNAELLFHKGLSFDTLHGPIARRLTEISTEKHQLKKEDIKKEIDEYFNILLKTDDLNDLINSLVFYSTRTDSSTVQYGYTDKAISLAEKLLELSLNDRYIRRQLSLNCSNLSYYSIFCKQYKNSLTAIKIAIKADSTYQGSYTNLPLVYLFNNMYRESETEYLKWKDTPWTSDTRFKTFREVFLADIADLESKGITHPDFAKIKELLKK
jgi:WD40 repeat protein